MFTYSANQNKTYFCSNKNNKKKNLVFSESCLIVPWIFLLLWLGLFKSLPNLGASASEWSVPFKPSFYGGTFRKKGIHSYSHSSNSVSSADSSTSSFSCNFDFKFQFDPEFHILLFRCVPASDLIISLSFCFCPVSACLCLSQKSQSLLM